MNDVEIKPEDRQVAGPLDLRVIEQIKDHLRTLEQVARVDLSASIFALGMLTAEVQQSRNAIANARAEGRREFRELLDWLVHLAHGCGMAGGEPEPGEWEDVLARAETALKEQS